MAHDMSCLSRDIAHAILAPVKWAIWNQYKTNCKIQNSSIVMKTCSQEARQGRDHSIEPPDKNKSPTVTITTFPHLNGILTGFLHHTQDEPHPTDLGVGVGVGLLFFCSVH